jgi:hypothetical protein
MNTFIQKVNRNISLINLNKFCARLLQIPNKNLYGTPLKNDRLEI